MSTGTAIVIVAGIGGALFLYFRSQQQQQAAIAAANAAQGAGQGGGIGGLANRLFQNFKADPLGIHNAEAVLGTGASIAKGAASGVAGVVSSIGGTIRGLF